MGRAACFPPTTRRCCEDTPPLPRLDPLLCRYTKQVIDLAAGGLRVEVFCRTLLLTKERERPPRLQKALQISLRNVSSILYHEALVGSRSAADLLTPLLMFLYLKKFCMK